MSKVDLKIVPEGTDLSPLEQEIVQDGADAVLDRIDKQRETAVKTLQGKLDTLNNRPEVAPMGVEDIIRDITISMGAVLEAAKASHDLATLLTHDVYTISSKQEQIAGGLFESGLNVQVLIALLTDKGLITKEEFSETFSKVLPEAVKQAQEVIKGLDNQVE